MVSDTLKVTKKEGLHLRPSKRLVQIALQFSSEIVLSYNGNEVNARSIMGLVTLGAVHDAQVQVRCEGPDAERALDAMRAFFHSGFPEEPA